RLYKVFQRLIDAKTRELIPTCKAPVQQPFAAEVADDSIVSKGRDRAPVALQQEMLFLLPGVRYLGEAENSGWQERPSIYAIRAGHDSLRRTGLNGVQGLHHISSPQRGVS